MAHDTTNHTSYMLSVLFDPIGHDRIPGLFLTVESFGSRRHNVSSTPSNPRTGRSTNWQTRQNHVDDGI